MKPNFAKHWANTCLAALAFAGLTACGTTGGKPPTSVEQGAALRAADEVLDRYVEASGGAEAIAAVPGIKSESELSHGPGYPVLRSMSESAPGGKARWEIVTPSHGRLLTICDGREAWMSSDRWGAGLMGERERMAAMRDADPLTCLRFKELFPGRRRLPDVTENDEVLQVVELTDRTGKSETWSFAARTGYCRKLERDGQTMRFSDERKIGRLVVSHRVEYSSGGASTLISFVCDEPVDEARFAIDPAALEDARKTRAIMQRYHEVSGGDALARVRSRVTHAEVSLPDQGLVFGMKLTQKRPAFALIENDIPGMGAMVQGYDGATGWSSSELMGYRELTGAELAQVKVQADLGAEARLQATYPFRRPLGSIELPTGPATGLELAGYSGSAGEYWFDDATGRLVRMESEIVTGPQSHIRATMDFDDYRDVDGALIAFRTRLDNPALKAVITLGSVENDVTVDDAIFKPRKDD